MKIEDFTIRKSIEDADDTPDDPNRVEAVIDQLFGLAPDAPSSP